MFALDIARIAYLNRFKSMGCAASQKFLAHLRWLAQGNLARGVVQAKSRIASITEVQSSTPRGGVHECIAYRIRLRALWESHSKAVAVCIVDSAGGAAESRLFRHSQRRTERSQRRGGCGSQGPIERPAEGFHLQHDLGQQRALSLLLDSAGHVHGFRRSD